MRHILLALLATSACTTSSTDAQVTSNLEQPNGGYDTADEAPEFGAAADFDAAAIEADAPVTDTMASDPTVTAMAALPTVDARDVIVASLVDVYVSVSGPVAALGSGSSTRSDKPSTNGRVIESNATMSFAVRGNR